MALSPTGLGAAMKPLRSRALFDEKAAGMTYDQWKTNTPSDAKMPSIAPTQVDDSVANKVAGLTSQNSVLMQAAKTEGLKAANRRGMLNSSLAAGSAMDAMTRYAMPIAQQDASQDFQRNAAARQFEYGMFAQDDSQRFQSGERALDRGLEREMQDRQIGLADRQQLRDIASREGLAAADRALQQLMQGRQISSQETMQLRDIGSREGLAAADRALQQYMQGRQIGSQEAMQQRDIDFRYNLFDRDAGLQRELQGNQIRQQTSQAALDRGLQERLASWNMDDSERNATAQLLSNMEAQYTSQYQAILANPNLDADARTQFMQSIKNLRDTQINFVEQIFQVDLRW